MRLMEGADIYQIAKNCRTSVEMIEKYYASHIKTSLDRRRNQCAQVEDGSDHEGPAKKEGIVKREGPPR